MWEDVAKVIGTSTIYVGGVAWLISTSVKHFLDKKVDRFKSSLQQDFEIFKLQLQKESLEHQVIYRRVDEKVADALHQVRWTPETGPGNKVVFPRVHFREE